LLIGAMKNRQPRPTVPSCSTYVPWRPLAETDYATVSETAAVPREREVLQWLQMSI